VSVSAELALDYHRESHLYRSVQDSKESVQTALGLNHLVYIIIILLTILTMTTFTTSTTRLDTLSKA